MPFPQQYRNPILDDEEDDPFSQQQDDNEPDDFELAGIPATAPPPPALPPLPAVRPGDEDQFGGSYTPPAPTTTASQRLQDILQRAPSVYQHKKPGVLNRIGAAAVGAGAGWNNANPRLRPVDVSKTMQGILYPGQAEREAQYGREVGAASAAAKGEQDQNYSQARNAELEARARAEQQRARAEEARATAYAGAKSKTVAEKYQDLIAANIPSMTPDIALSIAATGKMPANAPRDTQAQLEADLLKKVTDARGTADEQYYRDLYDLFKHGNPREPKPPSTLVQVNKRVGEKLGLVPNEKGEYWAPNSAVGTNERIENPREGEKPATRVQFANVEAKKQDALRGSQSQLQKDLANALSPEEVDRAWENHRERAQLAQGAYESEITSLTGNPVEHFEYPPVEQMRGGGGQSKPAPGTPPPTTNRAAQPAPAAAIPQRPASIPPQAKARYSPSTKQWQYSLDGRTWQAAQ